MWCSVALALAVLSFGGATVYERVVTFGIWPGVMSPYDLHAVIALALALLSAVAGVLVATRRPLTATALTLWPWPVALLSGVSVDFAWWLALLAIGALAAGALRRSAVVPVTLTLVAAVAYCWLPVATMTPIGPVDIQKDGGRPLVSMILYLVAVLAVVAIALAVGLTARARHRSAVAAAESRRALQVESTATERARVARDLHDVVAHHVSLIAVRAESAPFAHPQMDAESREVLREIGDDARTALTELRQVLDVLARGERGPSGGDVAARELDDGPALRPQPRAADALELIAQARDAGQRVRVEPDGDRLAALLAGVPAGPGYVLFRVLQESLTNARRHAPHASTDVTVHTDPFLLGLTVSNDLVGEVGPPGRGLLGMRERVEALGGSLGAERDGTRFVVDMALPLTSPWGAVR